MEKYMKQLIMNSPDQKISFCEYMEAVLYTPEIGYYMRSREKIGREGDFYTSVNVGDVFGRVLAKWFAYLIKEYNLPPTIIEMGSGDGKLAYDILHYWKEKEIQLFDCVEYRLVDRSLDHQQRQKERLMAFPQVSFGGVLEQNSEINGIVFSNELFDALPVHSIEKQNGEMVEVFVTVKNETLTEIKSPLKNDKITSYLESQNLCLKEGQRMEIPLQMVELYQNLASRIQSGLLVTIDYGYTDEEWEQPIHCQGSLRGYYQHRMVRNVLEHPGKMDLTSHIHFDCLRREGVKYGFVEEDFLQQQAFLVKAGIMDELEEDNGLDPFSETAKRNRAIRSLLVGGYSEYFRVLVQSKGLING
ncbi:SAM-dependent methyltransferase [Bacillus sp. JJ634]